MKKYLTFIVLAVVLCITASSPLLFETEERTQLKMHTFVRVILHGPRWMDFEGAFNRAFNAVDRVDNIANMYDPSSEVSRLNKNGHIKPAVVSDDLFMLIKDSIRLSQDSEGYFDITVVPLVQLWRRYQEEGLDPDANEIENALSLVDYHYIILDESAKSVFFKKEGVAIDLSAIAKGYAVDKAVEALKSCGFTSAVVNAGGDLYCLGKKYFFMKWRVGIVDPRDGKSIKRILHLTDRAAATSGGYEQFFSYNGKEYTHIIDTATGYPEEARYSSVTVLAPSCTLADAMATAVLAGGETVKEKLEQLYPGIEIIIEN